MNQEELKLRVKKFITEFNQPIAAFARNVGFDRSAYYKWIKGSDVFSEKRLQSIDAYLKKYDF